MTKSKNQNNERSVDSTPRMVYEGDDFTEGFNGIINFHNL